MTLQKRINGLNVLGSRFPHNRLDSMLLEHEIKPSLFSRLRLFTAVYLSKCLTTDAVFEAEQELLRNLESEYDSIRNITPNGMVVPKRHLTLEYNLVVQAFIDIIKFCNIDDLIVSWHIPLNIRIKTGVANPENIGRHHPTEDWHSDSWAGESSASVTTHIPIFGDVRHNHLEFCSPPDHFEEPWLGPQNSYRDGKSIAAKYKPVAAWARAGHLYFQDFAGLHRTARSPGAGMRISIDTTFVLRRPEMIDGIEHAWRTEERADTQFLNNVGLNNLLYFPDGIEDQVDSSSGFKHPTNLSKIHFEGV